MPVRTWRFTVWLLFRIHLHILDVTKPRSGTMIWSLRDNVFLGCQRVRQCIKVWNAPLFKKNNPIFHNPDRGDQKNWNKGNQRRSRRLPLFFQRWASVVRRMNTRRWVRRRRGGGGGAALSCCGTVLHSICGCLRLRMASCLPFSLSFKVSVRYFDD